MRLLLDVGNTAVKWALADKHRLDSQGRFPHRNKSFAAQGKHAWAGLPVPESVIVVNVAGEEMAREIAAFADRVWQLAPQFVTATRCARGVTNGYTDPGELGADRWVAMIAAHHLAGGTVCVVDCGTAITIDLVTADGQHQGGVIMPGVRLLSETLQTGTAGIRLTESREVAGLLGRTTLEGVTGGVQYLVATTIDRVINEVRKSGGGPVSVVLTGGDSEWLLSLLEQPVRHEPALVLQGLAMISEKE